LIRSCGEYKTRILCGIHFLHIVSCSFRVILFYILSHVRVSAPNLISIYLYIHSYNHGYYKFTTSLLIVLDLFCLASSSLSLISLSDPSLSVSSVSHPLKRILRGPEREHLIEQLGFIRYLGKSLPMYALSCERVCQPDNDTVNRVTEPLSSNGRPLRFRYSGFQRHATIYCYVAGFSWLIIMGFGLDDWIY
jgi:hypothetical protein